MTDETIAGADSGNQYGDYNGLSGYANSFFPSWTDRRNNAREEIWTALISLGPPPPPAPIIQGAGVAIAAENGTPINGVPDPARPLPSRSACRTSAMPIPAQALRPPCSRPAA